MADRDFVREAENALAKAKRSRDEAERALREAIGSEMLEAVLTPGLRKDEVSAQDTEEGYTAKLRASLRADFLRHSGGR